MNKVRVVYKADKSVTVLNISPKSRMVFFDNDKPCKVRNLSVPLGVLDENNVVYTLENEEIWLNRVFGNAMKPQYDADGNQINPLVGLSYDDIDSSELPVYDVGRDCWEGEKGKGVKVNQEKAAKNKIDKENIAKIEQRKKEILEQQAIEDLKLSGDLPDDY